MKNVLKKPIFWVLLLDASIVLCGTFVTYIARFISLISGQCLMKCFGLTCPGCGGTRCIFNFFKGNFIEAFEHNQFIFIMIIYTLVLVVLLNFRYVFGLEFAKKPISFMVHPKTFIVITVLILVFAVGRNALILLGYVEMS